MEPYFVTAHALRGALHAGTWGFPDSVFVDRFTGGAWTQVGGLASVLPGSTEPDRAAGPYALTDVGGVLHALWRTHSGEPYVSRFKDGAWQNVGGILPAGSEPGILRYIGGRLYVTWIALDQTSVVGRLNSSGTAWEPVAALPSPAQGLPVLTGIDGVPYVAYADASADGRLRVARLDGVKPVGADDNDGSDPPCGREIVGTAKNDRLTGGSGRDFIRGLAGNDTIRGLDGDDCLYGNQGADRIEGGGGVDRIEGGGGGDRLVSGTGNDVVSAGTGDDVVDSRGKGWDTIDCGAGRDRALVGDLDRVRNCERVENVD
jgi:hypothetical protein